MGALRAGVVVATFEPVGLALATDLTGALDAAVAGFTTVGLVALVLGPGFAALAAGLVTVALVVEAGLGTLDATATARFAAEADEGGAAGRTTALASEEAVAPDGVFTRAGVLAPEVDAALDSGDVEAGVLALDGVLGAADTFGTGGSLEREAGAEAVDCPVCWGLRAAEATFLTTAGTGGLPRKDEGVGGARDWEAEVDGIGAEADAGVSFAGSGCETGSDGLGSGSDVRAGIAGSSEEDVATGGIDIDGVGRVAFVASSTALPVAVAASPSFVAPSAASVDERVGGDVLRFVDDGRDLTLVGDAGTSDWLL
jgi:hypothetical protein